MDNLVAAVEVDFTQPSEGAREERPPGLHAVTKRRSEPPAAPRPRLTAGAAQSRPLPFSKGRLTAITRPGSTVAYTYDRFGRLLQDGALTYGYDDNGNRVELGYPDGVVARYGFDFADRESSLEIQEGSGPVQTLVTGAT